MPGTVASCVMLVHGDMDTVVPVMVGRAWAEVMKSVPMKTYQYIEVPGGDHGTVIGSHQAEIFAFFAKHSHDPEDAASCRRRPTGAGCSVPPGSRSLRA